MEDVQSVVCELHYMVRPGEVVADGEAQKLERLNLNYWLIVEINGFL